MDPNRFLAFVAAAVVLIGMPGPNNVYISTRSMAQGRRAGFVSALGVETGTLVHITLAAFGLAAVVATSPTVFRTMTYLGSAYLVYLGIRTLRSRSGNDRTSAAPRAELWRVYREGILVNLLSPKSLLFFFALLPQFTTPGAAPSDLRWQLLGLGASAFLIGLVLDFCYAIAADAAARRLSGNGSGNVRRYVAASVYFTLAALAIAGATH